MPFFICISTGLPVVLGFSDGSTRARNAGYPLTIDEFLQADQDRFPELRYRFIAGWRQGAVTLIREHACIMS